MRVPIACAEVRRRLDSYVDGELPAPLMRTLSAHLSRCPGCTEAHAALAHLLTVVRGAVHQSTVPTDVAMRLARVLRDAGEPGPPIQH